jgi:CRP-like cAMP-binding protein
VWLLEMTVEAMHEHEHSRKQHVPSHPLTTHGATVSPAKAGAACEETAPFDPRLLLTKLSAGKTSQEYQADEFVFSQGDAADAVFYIQSGKVKLTVVSKAGKEAVIAILQQASFSGEGCLAGQPLRMATANATEPSTIIWVEKQAMISLLHREPEFAERFLAYLLS